MAHAVKAGQSSAVAFSRSALRAIFSRSWMSYQDFGP
jgi:hypothetical protein